MVDHAYHTIVIFSINYHIFFLFSGDQYIRYLFTFFMLLPNSLQKVFSGIAFLFQKRGTNFAWGFPREVSVGSKIAQVFPINVKETPCLAHSICKMSSLFGTFADGLCEVIYERSLNDDFFTPRHTFKQLFCMESQIFDCCLHKIRIGSFPTEISRK